MKTDKHGWLPLIGVERGVGNRLTCVFAGPDYSMDVLFRCYDSYFTFLVTDVHRRSQRDLFPEYAAGLSSNYGGLLNTASGDGVSAVLLSCNDKTNAASSMAKGTGLDCDRISGIRNAWRKSGAGNSAQRVAA